MRETHRLSVDQVIQFMVGLETEYFRAEGDYATFIQTHLMPPLTGIRGGEGREPQVREREAEGPGRPDPVAREILGRGKEQDG